MQELTVATYNVFGSPFAGQIIKKTLLRTRVRKRLRIVGELLNSSTIDVLFFQEIHFYHHLFILKRKLSNYPYSNFEPFLYGPKGGVVTFSKEPIEKISYANFNNTGTYWNKSIVAKIGKRGILISKVKGESYYLCNTHLTQNSDHDWSPGNRFVAILQSQLTDAGEIMRKYKAENNTIILAGDFNMPKDSQYYTEFLTQNNLQDAFGEENAPTYIEEYAKDKRSIIREDYIFISSPKPAIFFHKEHIFSEKHKFTDGTKLYLSDHIGLRASIKLSG